MSYRRIFGNAGASVFPTVSRSLCTQPIAIKITDTSTNTINQFGLRDVLVAADIDNLGNRSWMVIPASGRLRRNVKIGNPDVHR